MCQLVPFADLRVLVVSLSLSLSVSLFVAGYIFEYIPTNTMFPLSLVPMAMFECN